MDELLARLRSEGEHETYPLATERDLEQTEAALGRALPPSFRRFLRGFSNGAYLFEIQEVSAVGAGNPQIGAIQDALPHVISASPDTEVRLDSGGAVLISSLVPFSLDHNGNCWCFLTSQEEPDGEYPVAYYDDEHEKLYGKLSGFEAWLTRQVDAEPRDEFNRTLYDDDVLRDEMNLG